MRRSDPFGEGEAPAKARRRRSLAIALALVGFVVIVFGTTMVRMGQNTRDAEPNEVQRNMGVADG